MNPWNGASTIEYQGYRVTIENTRHQRVARIYKDGNLVAWRDNQDDAIEFIDGQVRCDLAYAQRANAKTE